VGAFVTVEDADNAGKDKDKRQKTNSMKARGKQLQ